MKIIGMMIVLLSIGLNLYANDVVIDESGNLTTGTANNYGNLKVTGSSGEHGIVGEASGTGAAGVYGKTGLVPDDDYGTLGEFDGVNFYGVHGKSSAGFAGYFDGNTKVTGSLTVDGNIVGESDPTVALNVKDGVDWSELSGIPAGFADGIDNASGNDIWTLNGSNIYYSLGNVGIGTATPAGKLDVAGDICFGGVCRSTWPTGAGTGAFTDTGTTAYYTGGNVSIGTTTPLGLSGVDSKVLHMVHPAAPTGDTAVGLRLEVDGLVDAGIMSAYNAGGNGGMFVGSLSNHRLGLGTNSIEHVTITPSGNVGIGTPSPLQPLHVEGSAYISSSLGIGVSSPSNNLQISGSNALLSSGSGDFRLMISKNLSTDNASIIFQDHYSGYTELGLTGDNDFHIKTSADGITFSDAFMVDHSNGNIGVGTMVPEGKLNVLATDWAALFTENTGTQPAIYALKKGTGDAVYILKGVGSGYGFVVEQRGSDPAMLIKTFSSDLMIVQTDGKVGLGISTPTAHLDVSGLTGYNQVRMRASYSPTGTGDPNGNTGDIAWDDGYIYIKTSVGWKRSSLSTF